MEKINELQAFLRNSHQAILIDSLNNRRYFTGFSSSDGCLLVTKKEAVFFTDSRYIEAAQKNVTACKCYLLTRVEKEIKSYIKEKHIYKIYTEASNLSVATSHFLEKTFFPRIVTPSFKLENKINGLRATKTETEIDNIKIAQKIAEEAFSHILTFIRPGVTEKQIALELDFYMLSHGAESLSFETIAVAGKKTSMPHGVPDENIVRNGDFVTMDFGAVYKGYHSDMTRTVAVGEVTEKQREVYETVLRAQKAALSVLKSDIKCSVADKAARDIITEAGYGDYFGHATGHGVGVEIHEGPNLSPRSEDKLQEGNVVTVEPGIYLPDEFGVRIEDMAVIEKDGCLNLTRAPKELIIL